VAAVRRDPDLIRVRAAEGGQWEVEHPSGDVRRFPSRDEALIEAQAMAKAEGRKVVIQIRRPGSGSG
jgi:hypothetical protein